MELIHKSNRFT